MALVLNHAHKHITAVSKALVKPALYTQLNEQPDLADPAVP
jgi:hypothetical protein